MLSEEYNKLISDLDKTNYGTKESSELIVQFEELLEKINKSNLEMLEALKKFNLDCHLRGKILTLELEETKNEKH